MKMLQGAFAPGDTIRVDASASEDVLTFTKVASAPRKAGEVDGKEATLH
jgi:hypothetical protein